jgi:hypothetical protein
VIVQQMVEESCKLCYQLNFQCFPEKCIQILLVSGFNFILATELRTITYATLTEPGVKREIERPKID